MPGVLRTIVGFHADDAGDWVARLDCFHTVHVRHNPPFQVRPWVTDDAARAERLGTELECLRCERAELPHGLRVARTAGPFDQASLPAGLRRPHRVAAGTWGLLRVLGGSALFEIGGRSVRLERGDQQPIPPQLEHRVSLDDSAVIEIDFLVSAGGADGGGPRQL